VGLFSLQDAENGVRLLIELLKRLDQKTVESFL
jgi:putative aminopeptidase FrvX